jgi:hypothetical protein
LGTTLNLTPATVTVIQVDRDTVEISGLTLTAGNLLRVTVRNLRTQDNIPLLEDGVHNVAKVTVQDVTPPRIATARFFTTAPHVELTFNEPLDVNSARNPFNYSVRATDNSEFPDVTDATYDGTTVKLTLDSDLTAGKEYEVTANVRDLAGNFGSLSQRARQGRGQRGFGHFGNDGLTGTGQGCPSLPRPFRWRRSLVRRGLPCDDACVAEWSPFC